MTDVWCRVSMPGDITGEVIDIFRSAVDISYPDGPVDWEDVWDRVDGRRLDDGRLIDLGEGLRTPAFRAMKKIILNERSS